MRKRRKEARLANKPRQNQMLCSGAQIVSRIRNNIEGAMMRIFVEERYGTPISPEEREFLEKEIADLQKYRTPEKLHKAVVSMVELCGWWSEEAELNCLDADAWGIGETLKTGIVQSW